MTNLIYIESMLKMPLMALPVRTVVVPIGDRKVILSPGSKLDSSRYDRSWNVTEIVAPNLFHGAGVKKAKQVYPNSQVWGCVGIEQKRPKVSWDRILGVDPWPYQDELSVESIAGMPSVSENVFIHKPSKSLIVTDLCFNIVNDSSFGARLILGLFGTYKKVGTSRFFAAFIKDRDSFRQSMKNIFAYDFENIIVSHGENVIGNGKEALRAALRERGLEAV